MAPARFKTYRRECAGDHRAAAALANLLGAVAALAELAADPDAAPIAAAEIVDIDLARAKLARLLARIEENSRQT